MFMPSVEHAEYVAYIFTVFIGEIISYCNSFQGAIAILSAKTKLLDPSQLEQIEGRVNALGSRLNTMSDKKEAIEEADKGSKVSLL